MVGASLSFLVCAAFRGDDDSDSYRTCKYLYKLCASFAYRDFVSTANSWFSNVYKVSKWVENGSSVRNVRILLDPEFASLVPYWDFLVEVLASFTNVTSLALYYRSYHTSPRHVTHECINLLKTGNVREFGIYSITILHREIGNPSWDRHMALFAYDVIQQYTNNAAAANNLRVLDLAVETIPTEIYNLVRTQFPNLRMMNIRRAFRCPTLGRIWDASQVQYWSRNNNLTRLSLIDCSSAYAFHIPHLVRHFTSLRELIVSTCGTGDDDRIGILRCGGWSTESDALCSTRAPLDVFHIEHMTGWEIGALGVIPTKELVTSLLTRGDLETAFTRDPEIFPGLVVLRVEDYVDVQRFFASGTVKNLSAICAGRGLKIEKNAKWIRRRNIRR